MTLTTDSATTIEHVDGPSADDLTAGFVADLTRSDGAASGDSAGSGGSGGSGGSPELPGGGSDKPAADGASVPPVAPVAPAAGQAATPSQPTGDPDDSSALQWLLQNAQSSGLDISKYRTFDDAIKGLIEQGRFVGQKNDDAMLGRMFRENPAAALAQMGYQFPQQPQQQQSQQQQWTPPTFEQFRLLASQLVTDPETGELKPAPGAPPNALTDYRAISDAVQRMTYMMATSPEQVLAPLVQRYAEQMRDQTLQTVQGQIQQREWHNHLENQWSAWSNQSAAWLYNDGDARRGLSPAGQAFQSIVRENNLLAPVFAGQQPLESVLNLARDAIQRRTQVAQPLPVPPQAHRVPNVASPMAPEENPNLPRKGETLEAHLTRMFRSQGLPG